MKKVKPTLGNCLAIAILRSPIVAVSTVLSARSTVMGSFLATDGGFPAEDTVTETIARSVHRQEST